MKISNNMSNNVWVREVGTRDGLQSIDTIFTTDSKVEWIKQEAAAGIPEIEVGSFVPAKLLPQLADTTDVILETCKINGLRVSALVPNFRGAIDGMVSGVHQLNYVLSVSEAHSQANTRKTVDEAVLDFSRIVSYRKDNPEYHHVLVGAGLATAFGCTIAGQIDENDVLNTLEALLEFSPDEVVVADTVGFANPTQCRRIFKQVLAMTGNIPVSAHFHDTRGLGLANVAAALDVGVRRFDASLGGLGGCPYAPGASGNVVTEDLVFMLDAMGMDTGISLDKLLLARTFMESNLNGEVTKGAFVHAGFPKGFKPESVF
ncbi:hydroxymethylglutaryl-CoA lyase [Gammaproteobacteria bacterium]|nr:hydroxymethylglutaryl-CoA lyase [Gammaproteobacteria bacterium]